MIPTQTGPMRTRLPALHSLPALIMTAALLLAAAACGRPSSAGHALASALPARQEAAPQPGSPAGSPGRLAPLSASFTSASTGWLLAAPPCADAVHACRILLRKTTDGGRTWFAVPAPPAPGASQPGPGAGAISEILFTSSRDGWAWGPGLWRTRNGSTTWRRLTIPGGRVQSLAAGDGHVLAATGQCGPSPWQCRFQVYSAAAGSDDWRPVPGAAGAQVSSASLVVSGHAGYVFATTQDLGKPLLITGPVNGSARWRSLPVPCPSAWSAALAAAPGGWLFLGCGSEPSAGSQYKTAYVSGNGGRTWRQVASPPVSGYLGAASMSPAGTIFLSGGRMDVYISWNRGRSWHTSPSLDHAASQAGAGFNLLASAATDTQGFAFQEGVYRHQIWLTRDGGRHWTPVTAR
jgi:hypothetical protein